MPTFKKCSFYRDSQNLTVGREYCDLVSSQTICGGSVEFCENLDVLRKRVSEHKGMEGRNNQREEGKKKTPSHYRFLVVDDEDPMRELVAASLSSHGHQCVTASNGPEALKTVRENKFDAVITDIVMPGMDGIVLSKEILGLYPHLPIMVMTGHGKEYAAESAIEAGARDFIEKPFSIDEFVVRLTKMMRDHEILCQIEAKKNETVSRLSKKTAEEVNELKREIESLKSKLWSAYTGSR